MSSTTRHGHQSNLWYDEPIMTNQPKPKKRSTFNAPHPNSILAKSIDDPETRKRYEEWRSELVADEAAMRRWARNDFQSMPGAEVSTIRIRSRRSK